MLLKLIRTVKHAVSMSISGLMAHSTRALNLTTVLGKCSGYG
ncbi:hypothetical protein BU9_CDS0022 [Klebsiella phage Kpn BU9]|nr:hypothetical protein BU9_CDS0022 [Klebsiella phage Kpn BU9]